MNINIKYINYKNPELLKKFLNPNGRILSRRRTHMSAKEQRKLACEIKHARFMALLPFIAR